MNFEFATAPRIVFGPGVVVQSGVLASGLGRRALVVTGRSRERAARLLTALDSQHVFVEVFSVHGEPTVDVVVKGAAHARAMRADVVVAIGGGSVLDTGKAIAALAANDGDVFDYLETIGRARPFERRALPVVALPTTAGTGSEVTKNAVVSSAEHRVKVSLRHVSMLPRAAIVDPELALGLPREVTAATGLDALTQLIEPYVSCRHTPVADVLAVEGMRRASRSLRVVTADGHNIDARSDMALAALYSGMCLANAALGAVHGIAGPLGGLTGAPHGALCAALLPHVMGVNIAAARRAVQGATLARYDDVARIVTGHAAATADDGVAWISELVEELQVPRLSSYGLTAERINDVIGPARRASSMKGNPVELENEEIREILERAL